MPLECPHCASPLDFDLDREVRTDGGHGTTDYELYGLHRQCADCGHQLDLYVY